MRQAAYLGALVLVAAALAFWLSKLIAARASTMPSVMAGGSELQPHEAATAENTSRTVNSGSTGVAGESLSSFELPAEAEGNVLGLSLPNIQAIFPTATRQGIVDIWLEINAMTQEKLRSMSPLEYEAYCAKVRAFQGFVHEGLPLP